MVKLVKLKASTLIESIVALVIITLLFGISFSILTSIAGRNNSQIKLKASFEAQRVITLCISQHDFEDYELKFDGLTVEKVIKSYHEYKDLRLIEVNVFNDNGKLLLQRHELINISK